MSESSKRVDLSTHPLVANLHPDPDAFKDLATFTGYFGPSKKEGHVRLYLDLTFKHYYELPSGAVLESRPSKADDPQSPTIVTVDGQTKLTAVSVSSTDTAASFLSGSISSGHLPAAQVRPATGNALGPCNYTSICMCYALSLAPTLAGALGGPMCCNPTYTAGDCTRQGPSLADARARVGDCACILLSAVVNTLGGPQPAVGCACILLSAVVNTLGKPEACIQVTGTTVCTPTGVPYLCPGAVAAPATVTVMGLCPPTGLPIVCPGAAG